MKDIEWVERYLLHQLKPEEKFIFEQRTGEEPPLKELLSDLGDTLHIFHRNWIRRQLTGTVYPGWKWITSLFAGLAVIGISFFFQTTRESKKRTPVTQVKSPLLISVTDTNAGDILPPLDTLGTKTNRPVIRVVGMLPTKSNTLIQRQDSIKKPEWIYPPEKGQSYLLVNTHIENTIEQDGLLVILPPNSLEFPNGTVPDSAIISVAYYANYYKMWKDTITTTSGENLLISGGSCLVKAKWNDTDLSLKKDSAITLMFPSIKPDPRMKTFIGKRDTSNTLNWEMQNALVEKATLPIVQIDSEEAYTKYYFDIKASDDIPIMDSSGITTTNIISQSEAIRKYLGQFDSLSENDFKILIENNIKLHYTYFYKGNSFKGFEYSKTGNKRFYKNLDRRLQYFSRHLSRAPLESLPPLAATSGKMKLVLTPLSRTIFKKDTIERMDSLDSESEKQIKENHNYNTIISRNFGYINCDYFPSYMDKTDVEIILPAENVQVTIFFKEFRAAAKCITKMTKARIPQMPTASKVILVATSNTSDGLKMCVMETEIKDRIILNQLEPMNFQKLQKALGIIPQPLQ